MSAVSLTERVLDHYESDGLLARIEAGLATLGESPAAPTIEALSPVDEFHIRGKAATQDLISRLGGRGRRARSRCRLVTGLLRRCAHADATRRPQQSSTLPCGPR